MNILEINPDIKLMSIISSYYFIDNQKTAHENIPPLGHPVIQFHLKNCVDTFFCNYDFQREEVMIVGQLSKFANVNFVNESSMIGVNLKPTALYKLIHKSLKHFTDKGTPALPYFGNEIYYLHNTLKVTHSNDEKALLLNNFFQRIINEKPVLYDKFDELIDLINESKGNLSLDTIKAYCYVSERTLQRKFADRIGLSLKTYLRVIRNLYFFELINQNSGKTISEIIFELGYFDYSHFIKDFKLMTNTTPQKYFSNDEQFIKLFHNL